MKEYMVDTTIIGRRLTAQFLEDPTSGATYLYEFAQAACEKVAASAKFPLALWITQLSSHFGWFLCEQVPEDLVIRSRFHQDVLRFFRAYNTDLQSPAKAVDVGLSKDLIVDVAALLQDMCQWSDHLASQLAEELLDFGDPESPTSTSSDEGSKDRLAAFRQPSLCLPALVSNAWKFKLLRKYVVKGRMELRVLSINTMDAALVDIWREYNTVDAGTNHPVMQYLAQFLLHERVINYIISVDSHPQLISRSGNIVGFLVVTHRYSESQTDAIWQTVSNSQDPRVVSATLAMLRNITGLMEPPELLYICKKLYELPIDNYNLDMVKFLSDVASKVNSKFFDWSSADPTTRPWNVCIRLIQDTAPSRQSTKTMLPLHERACLELHGLAGSVGVDERRQIYKDCAVHIKDRSSKATGSIRAIYTLCSNTSFADGNFFKQNKDVTRQILEELCFFIETENSRGLYEHYYNALNYRLEMLRFILQRASDAIPIDLYHDLWDHLVGKHALNHTVRDMAWSRICEALRFQPNNDFCKQLISSYVSTLEPEFFTGGLYDFVASYRFPITRQLVTTDDGEKELLQIRGADLLWRIILSAPQGTIEEPATKLLASRYVAIDADQGVTLEEIEDTHIALVEKCTRELLAAYKALRSKSGHDLSSEKSADDSMDVSLSDTARRQMELQFGRTLYFEKYLLQLLRSKPEFSRTPRSDSKIEVMDQDIAYGDAVDISFTMPSSSEKRTIYLGMENTLQNLETRVCNMSGCTKVNLFFRGQRMPIATKGQQTLAEYGLGTKAHLLVQKAAGSETSQPILDSTAGTSVFETTVLNHFDDLFACMDSDDDISSMVCFCT
jgi:ubiquitin carboxyl-terminal hydrolase 34